MEGEAGARAEGAACGRVRKIRLKEMRCVWAALHEEIRLGKKTKEKKNGIMDISSFWTTRRSCFVKRSEKIASTLQVNLLHR